MKADCKNCEALDVRWAAEPPEGEQAANVQEFRESTGHWPSCEQATPSGAGACQTEELGILLLRRAYVLLKHTALDAVQQAVAKEIKNYLDNYAPTVHNKS